MLQLELLVISGSAIMTKFMQSCDVFEKFKVIGAIRRMTITFKDGEVMYRKKMRDTIENLKESLENSEVKELVTFIAIERLIDGKNITLHPTEDLYFNPEVIMVSDGTKFFMLRDFLKRMKYIVEEKKEGLCYIENIKYPQYE